MNHPLEVDSSLIIKLTRGFLTFTYLNERRQILPLVIVLTVYCLILLGVGVEHLYTKIVNSFLSGRWVVTSKYCIVSKKHKTELPCRIKFTFTLETRVSWRRYRR